MNPHNPWMKWAIRSLLIFAIVASSLSLSADRISAYWGWPSDPQPELSGSVSVSSGNVTAGQTVTVNYSIYCNSPGICITGWWSGGWLPWTNNVYVSTSEGGTGTLLKSFGANLIQANSSVSGSFTATIPSTLKSGTYWITFYVDVYGIFYGIRQDGNSFQEVPETNENNNISSVPIQVTGIKSDLSPTSISLSGANIETGKIVAGKDLTVNFTIQNNGDVASGAFSNSIYLATTQYGIQTLLGTFPMASIPAGASASDSQTVTIPLNQATGTYWITVYADSANVVSEYTKNNNINGASIQVISAPDLFVSSVSVPASVTAGQQATVDFTIENKGDTASGPFSNSIYLYWYKPGYGSYLQQIFGPFTMDSIPGNSSASDSRTVTIPATAVSGSYDIYIGADSANAVKESKEDNNGKYFNFEVTAIGPDLSPGSVSVNPTSAKAGETVTVSFTIQNKDLIIDSGPFSNGICLSNGQPWSWNGCPNQLGTFPMGALPANSSASDSRIVTIPWNVPSGNYQIYIFADSGAQVVESSETNNKTDYFSSTPIQVTSAVPDLSPGPLYLNPTVVAAGQTVTVNFQINNIGTAASGSFSNSIYLAKNPWEQTGTLLGSFPMGGIAAGASASDSRTVTIPSGTPNEFYSIIVFADSGETVNELAENNNAGDGAIIYVGSYYQNIPSLPDLTTSSVSLSASGVNPGENVAVSFTINNNGSAKAGPFSIRISLATSQYGTQTLLGALFYGGMWGMSGQGFSVQYGNPLSFTIPAGTPAGNYWITVWADSGQAVTEDNENNNIVSAPFQVNGPPAIKTTTLIKPNGSEIWAGGSGQYVTWTASDITDTDLPANPITLEYTVDGTTWIKDVGPFANTGSFYWIVPFVNSTTVKVRITAKDKAGNTSSDVSDANFTIDSDPPTMPGNLSASYQASTKSITFTWTDSTDATSGLDKYERKLDGGSWQNNGELTVWSTTAIDGPGTFQVRAVDLAGLVSPAASLDFIFDSTPPTPPANLAKTTPNSNNKPAFSWTASADAASGVDRYEAQMDSGAWTNIGNVVVYTWLTALSDGSHTLNLKAVDKANNTGQPASLTFTIDATGPAAPLNLIKTTPDNNNKPAFTWTAPVDVSGIGAYQVKMDSGPWSAIGNVITYTWPVTLSDGNHTLNLVAVDSAGNAGAPASLNFSIDTTPPTSPTNLAISSSLTNGKPTFTWTAAVDSVSGIDYYETRLDSQPWVAIGNVTSYTSGTPDGIHTVNLRAVDKAGNTGLPASLTFILDTTPPTTPTGLTRTTSDYNTKPSFTWTASSDATSGMDYYEVKLDSGSWTNTGNVTTYTWPAAISAGSHTLNLRAVDKAGNAGSSANISFTMLPNQSPVAVISNPQNGDSYFVTDNISFNGAQSFDSDNDTMAFEWSSSIDGILGTTATLVKKLTTGSHTISLKVGDGKEGQSTASVSITVKQQKALYVSWGNHNTPASIKPGQIVSVNITLTNTGSQTWSKSGANSVYVSYHWYNASWQAVEWGIGMWSALPNDVASGQSVSLTASLKAPSTPGSYNLLWDAIQQGVAWFSAGGSPLGVATGITVAATLVRDAQWMSLGTPSSIKPGEVVSVPIAITNTGSQTWPKSGANPVYVTYHWFNSSWQAVEWGIGLKNSFASNVANGQSASLTASLKAPPTPGSYNLLWDVLQEGVAWFSAGGVQVGVSSGITVATTQSRDIQWTSLGTPASIKPGQIVTAPITITNTGSQTWSKSGANGVYVTYHWYNSSWQAVEWGIGMWTALPNDVATGQSVTINAVLKAPSTPGSYNLLWDAIQQGVAWFSAGGAPLGVASGITVAATQARDLQWTSQSTPGSIQAGQVVGVPITLTNTGSHTWPHSGSNGVYVTYHWYNSSWQAVEWGIGMWSALPNDVATGQSVSITAALKAPSAPGSYNLLWDAVQQGVTWFSGAGAPLLPVSGIAVQ